MKRLFILATALVVCNALPAQIPNSDFELWDSSAGYKVPVGWDNMNSQTNGSSVYTCLQNSPGYTGSYYMALNTEDVPGMGIVPGIAVSGKLDPVSHLPISGFPYSSRPQVLAGEWQYMAYSPTDKGFIWVLLSKWNTVKGSRDTVSFTNHPLPGMAMVWQSFDFLLNYQSAAIPDSAMIFMSSSGNIPVAYSFLWVDDLRLTDTAALPAPYVEKHPGTASLFPNPAKGLTTLTYWSATAEQVIVSLAAIDGKEISKQSFAATAGDNNIPLRITRLNPGLYLIRVTGDQKSQTLKLLVE